VSEFSLRRARLADVPALQSLIATSARALSRRDYTPEQIEAALRGAFGVDTQLIRDGSYFVIEADGRLAGCGGWSRRRTLFGSDVRADRDATELDPLVDAAKIRAFFIHPDCARRGLGTRLLERCEYDAVAHGFSRLELMATLPGVRLYAARGYQGTVTIDWPLGEGLSIRFLPMSKPAPPFPYRIRRASADAAPAILALQRLAYQSEARLYDDFSLPPLTQTLDSLRAEFDTSCVLEALDGEIPIGSVRAREADGVCRIGRLIVSPPLQGSGVGTRLMRAIEAEFPKADCFELFTGSRSEANIRLYERLGYRRSREQALSPTKTLVFLEKRR
jgi:N-acetylglutamate synthase-like GNAT family acetyltransferase